MAAGAPHHAVFRRCIAQCTCNGVHAEEPPEVMEALGQGLAAHVLPDLQGGAGSSGGGGASQTS